MKINLFIALLFVLTVSNAQDSSNIIAIQLKKFKESKDAKVSVGLSPSEVKAEIGNPDAVEGGFPNSRELILHESPDMAGQINNSTWFYFLEPTDIVMPEYSYYVNGHSVDKITFQDYRGTTEVYYMEGELISQGMGRGYKITKNKKLKIEPLDLKTTHAETSGGKPGKVIPMYCVIFDKGTQVVAATRAYYLKN